MKIKFSGNVSGEIIETKDLLSYLSQVVLSKIDEEAKKLNLNLKSTKNSLSELKKSLKLKKDGIDLLLKQQAKEQQIKRLLTIISTLKKEGRIRGQMQKQIVDVLNKITTLDYHKLRSVEERLSLLLPDS